MDSMRVLAGVGLLGLVASMGCSSNSLSDRRTNNPNPVGQAVGDLLPSLDALDYEDPLDGATGTAAATIGETSEIAIELRDVLNNLQVAQGAYCMVRRAILGVDNDTTVSFATITETRFLKQSLDVVRFERFFGVGERDECEAGQGTPSEASPAFYVRLDLTVWSDEGTALSLPSQLGSVGHVMGFLQVSDDNQFDDDTAVGESVALVFATGRLDAAVPLVFTEADFPAMPANRSKDHLAFWFDLPQLLGDARADGRTDLMLTLDHSTSGQREVLAAQNYAAVESGRELAFDARFLDGLGITVSFAQRSEADVDVIEVPGAGFFLTDGSAAQGTGFVIDSESEWGFYEAWAPRGVVTHDETNASAHVVPTQFVGWPGDSTTWTESFGRGMSQAFTDGLAAQPAPTAWYPATPSGGSGQ